MNISIKKLVTFPMTSQSGLFRAISDTFAENDPFSYGFQLSWYRARSWTSFILCECIKQS